MGQESELEEGGWGKVKRCREVRKEKMAGVSELRKKGRERVRTFAVLVRVDFE